MGRIKKLERVVEHLWELEKKINTLIINLKDIKDNDLFAFRMEVQQTIKDEHKEIWVGIELKKSTLDIDIFSAKKRLRKTLPQYTMPKRLFVLPSMPLNINGKVDRLKVKQIINENILKKSSS